MADLKFQAYVQIDLEGGKTLRVPDDAGNSVFILTVTEAQQASFTGFDLSNIATLTITYGVGNGTTTGLGGAYTNATTDDPIVTEQPILWENSYSIIRNESVQAKVVNVSIKIERLDWHTSDEVQ